jgi:hypothetical protein
MVLILGIALVFALLFFPSQITAANTSSNNSKNVSVVTTVKITDAKPEVLAVTVYQAYNTSQRNITLSAGTTRTVT